MGKEMRSVKLPDMLVGTISSAAAIHNSKVYISAMYADETDELVHRVLVYSTNEQKWNVLEAPKQHCMSAIAVVDNHITLIGGIDAEAEVTNTLSTLYEEEGQWKQVLPLMHTGRCCPDVISHDNLLLVTGGLAEDDLTVLDILDLTTMKWTAPEGLNLPIQLFQHDLALCGEYLYLVGGVTVVESESTKACNPQAWTAKWSDVKQTAAPQHSQPQRVVWTRIADPPTLSPTLVSCGGKLYTVGGERTGDNKPISTVYTYITARDQWVSVGDMSVGRVGHCAVPLSSNTIFVAGGSNPYDGGPSMSLLPELLQL